MIMRAEYHNIDDDSIVTYKLKSTSLTDAKKEAQEIEANSPSTIVIRDNDGDLVTKSVAYYEADGSSWDRHEWDDTHFWYPT